MSDLLAFKVRALERETDFVQVVREVAGETFLVVDTAAVLEPGWSLTAGCAFFEFVVADLTLFVGV